MPKIKSPLADGFHKVEFLKTLVIFAFQVTVLRTLL